MLLKPKTHRERPRQTDRNTQRQRQRGGRAPYLRVHRLDAGHGGSHDSHAAPTWSAQLTLHPSLWVKDLRMRCCTYVHRKVCVSRRAGHLRPTRHARQVRLAAVCLTLLSLSCLPCHLSVVCFLVFLFQMCTVGIQHALPSCADTTSASWRKSASTGPPRVPTCSRTFASKATCYLIRAQVCILRGELVVCIVG